MSDRFHPISMEQLTSWVFTELERNDSLFNVPRHAFFVPRPEDRFRTRVYGVELDTPFGVAAGPHTQMAQNIVTAWLVGARMIELKTVQTLDELDVNKPCIDVQDEGYNVEWSQELKIRQSFDEYLRAWVLIHALHHRFGWPGERPGVVFNMSVGYNLEGILKPNVQWFLDTMADASAYLPACIDSVARHYPAVREIAIPSRLSDSITLSTMHGCPPDEIEAISRYLLEDRGLNTYVKCNPTLLGAERVRSIVNDDLGFTDVPIPDEAFGHDLKWADAVPMFDRLRHVAAGRGLAFGLKLSNTLEVKNWRSVFQSDPTMYMSGRPLHAVTVNLAARLAEEFRGDLTLSFAGGADCFNVADLLRSGMSTITVASDLLKTGGYLRLLQYVERTNAAMDEASARDFGDFVCRTALREPEQAAGADFAGLLSEAARADGSFELPEVVCEAVLRAIRGAGEEPAAEAVRGWAANSGVEASRAATIADLAIRVLARINLRAYADAVRTDWRYQKQSFRMDRSKTPRQLDYFDCIKAPCLDECPVDQKVPQYMKAVLRGEFAEAVRITREDNPLPVVLGRVCDHLCESTCIRTHLDQPLAIRHIKRFIMEQEATSAAASATGAGAAPSVAATTSDAPASAPSIGGPGSAATTASTRVAVIGAGPAGLAAAEELARAGFAVTIFEAQAYAGGMVGGAIPAYRLPQAGIDQDLAVLARLGVEIRYGMRAGADFTLDGLREQGFGAIFVAVGAQLAKRLNLAGEDAAGIVDGITFLRGVREGRPLPIGARVAVIGAGDTAMDCVRSARRVGATDVSLIYRRTVDQMPADREEIHAIREEGIEIIELARPAGLHVENGRLAGLVCSRTEYRNERDSSGRKVPFDVPDSDFEIELDTLIMAISQHSILDFFGDRPPQLTRAGYIAVDPETLETSIPGVYAGGDVADHGPASIVRAAADGKRAAAAIVAATHGTVPAAPAPQPAPNDFGKLVVRRAHREYRVPIEFSPVDHRSGFEETVLGYTREEAIAEAGRCLDCHEICSLCVSVCPNMALMTYRVAPLQVELPSLTVSKGTAVTGPSHRFVAGQELQIAVLTDFCNECGNCVTVCPTSGQPFRDKPRLYLDRADFEAQDSNAFMVMGESSMEARFGGQTHRIEVEGQIEYSSPSFRATLDLATLDLIEAKPTGAGEGEAFSLVPAAVMAMLLTGLRKSMPHIPIAGHGGAGA